MKRDRENRFADFLTFITPDNAFIKVGHVCDSKRSESQSNLGSHTRSDSWVNRKPLTYSRNRKREYVRHGFQVSHRLGLTDGLFLASSRCLLVCSVSRSDSQCELNSVPRGRNHDRTLLTQLTLCLKRENGKIWNPFRCLETSLIFLSSSTSKRQVIKPGSVWKWRWRKRKRSGDRRLDLGSPPPVFTTTSLIRSYKREKICEAIFPVTFHNSRFSSNGALPFPSVLFQVFTGRAGRGAHFQASTVPLRDSRWVPTCYVKRCAFHGTRRCCILFQGVDVFV